MSIDPNVEGINQYRTNTFEIRLWLNKDRVEANRERAMQDNDNETKLEDRREEPTEEHPTEARREQPSQQPDEDIETDFGFDNPLVEPSQPSDDHDTENPQLEPSREAPEDVELDLDLQLIMELVVEHDVEEVLHWPAQQHVEEPANSTLSDH